MSLSFCVTLLNINNCIYLCEDFFHNQTFAGPKTLIFLNQLNEMYSRLWDQLHSDEVMEFFRQGQEIMEDLSSYNIKRKDLFATPHM